MTSGLHSRPFTGASPIIIVGAYSGMNSASLLIRCGIALLLSTSIASAQQAPPAEPPQPLPGSSPDQPTLRVTTQEVLVPTLVEAHGGILYGLKADDFVLQDNGVPQNIRVQEEMDTAPVALVVAIEQARMSALEFDKFSHLGPLLDSFLTDPRSQAALIGFASAPHLLRD